MNKLIMNVLMMNKEVKSCTVVDFDNFNSKDIALTLLFKSFLEYHANNKELSFPKDLDETEIFRQKSLICLAMMDVFEDVISVDEIAELLEDGVFNEVLYDYFDEEIEEDEICDVGFELQTDEDIKEVKLRFKFNEKEEFEIEVI